MSEQEAACLKIYNLNFQKPASALYFNGEDSWHVCFDRGNAYTIEHGSASAGSDGNNAINRYRQIQTRVAGYGWRIQVP